MALISSKANIIANETELGKKSSMWPARVIGITGGPASGKSTVGRILSELSFTVFDTDRIARDVVKPGSPALEELVKAFGTEILKDGKTLDRKRMLDIILTDVGARRLVEKIIHPRVFRQMDQMLEESAATGHDVVFVEVPLLFEVGWQGLFDYIVTVTAPEPLCIRRLTERKKISIDRASRWMATQMPQKSKAGMSDYVIHNSAGLDELQIEVNNLARVLTHLDSET